MSGPASLKQRAVSAGSWNLAGYALSQAIRLGSTLIMTRLLAPEMFGVMAIATMVTVILWLLSDIGIRQNIIQSKRGDDPAFLDTAWSMQVARGGVLWAIALLSSAALYLANVRGMLPAGSAYAAPLLPAVIAVSSFTAVIQGLQSTRMATAYRLLEQKRLIQIELLAQVVALAAMVVIGALRPSIWVLVTGGLVASATSTLLSHTWMEGHVNRFRWDAAALRELRGFGKWIFLSSAVGTLATNGDRLLLGGLVEVRILGLYVIAALIVGSVEGAMRRIFARVALPTLSEVARNDASRLREVHYRLQVPTDLFLLFLAGLLAAGGQVVVDVLYDARYSAAGGILQVLSVSLFAVRFGIAEQSYLALGLPSYLTAINLVRFGSLYATVPALYMVAGEQGAIWGIALHALATAPLFYYFNTKLGLIDLRRELLVLVALPAGYAAGAGLHLATG